MARPADRMRLKDKLVDNVSKGIKSIQEYFYYHAPNGKTRSPEENTVIIDNRSHACHKLLDSLDHALLHGIRNVTHGYWRVVKQLSHKGMVSEIESLPSVTTDLGRGRAWLHASLNEALLESYIRLLSENEKLVKKHYAKDSLVMDKDDLPYLDLCPSPPRTRTESYEENDSSFVRSSTSRSSLTEPRLSSPFTKVSLQSDSDSTSVSSYDIHSQSDGKDRRSSDTFVSRDSFDSAVTVKSMQNIAQGDADVREAKPFGSDFENTRSITPNDSTSVSSFGSTGDVDRHKRLENILIETEDLDNMDDKLEVIHIRGKKGNSSSKGKKKKQKSTPEVGRTGRPRRNSTKESLSEKDDISGEKEKDSLKEAFCDKNEWVRDESDGKSETSKPLQLPQVDSESDISALSSSFQRSPDATPVVPACEDSTLSSVGPVKEDGDVENSHLSTEVSAISEIEKRIAAMFGTGDDNNVGEKTTFVSDNSLGHFPPSSNNYSLANDKYDKDSKSIENIPLDTGSDPFPSFKSEDSASKGMENGSGSSHNYAIKDHIGEANMSQEDTDDNFDFYSSNFHDDVDDSNDTSHSSSKKSEKRDKQIAKLHEESHLPDYMDYILKGPESPDNVAIKEVPDNPPDLCIRLDNNMKLQVMLDIFKQEDESFVKMFVCWENHTEGDPAVAYVLVSDQYLYILHLNRQSRKFVIQSITRLLDIIFISTGLHDQTLNIESRDKSKQKQRLWLTPGYQALTQAIVECLTEAVKKAVDNFASVRSRFSVGSDVPLQKIGLRKYLCKQLNCESQDISIKDYSLVYWEDPSSSSSSSLDAVTKEGTLLLHTQDPLKGHIWKPVYVVLKSGMLCISNKKSDPKPHSYLGLGGDQCIGCRRATVGDRQNCMELVMAQAGSWFLTAATSSEIVDWTHALCLAVSQGIQEEGCLKDCTPCCSVLACNKIFMCHEDLNTRFFRTLGSAQVQDVTGISVDKDECTYCIVEFESTEAGVVSGQWIFYFASASDASRFISALDLCWKDIYEVDLTVTTLDNVTLQRHCQNRIKHLRNALTVL